VGHIVLDLGMAQKYESNEIDWKPFRAIDRGYHASEGKLKCWNKSNKKFENILKKTSLFFPDMTTTFETTTHEPPHELNIIYEMNKTYINLEAFLFGWILHWFGLGRIESREFHKTGLLFPSKKNQSATEQEEGESPKKEKTGTWEIPESEIRDLNRISLQQANDPNNPIPKSIQEIVDRVKSAIVIVDFDNDNFSEEIQAMNEYFDQSDSECPLNFRECEGLMENHANMCWLLQEERKEDGGEEEHKEEHGLHVDMFGREMQFIKLKGTITAISESLFSPIMPREISDEEEDAIVTSEEVQPSYQVRTAPNFVHDNRHINLLRDKGVFSDDFLKDEEPKKRLISIIPNSIVQGLARTVFNSGLGKKVSSKPKSKKVLKNLHCFIFDLRL